ncbi:unnamed protein product [Protopolystoma xenopodis]|uniref:Uncharacterized protein n=1 Tax=Protopolystoma xenopodis TaxID=117903 RepID=A0A448WZ50_9PLAT|nr:unnamed protein product [Protopolystoma xenopodis]
MAITSEHSANKVESSISFRPPRPVHHKQRSEPVAADDFTQDTSQVPRPSRRRGIRFGTDVPTSVHAHRDRKVFRNFSVSHSKDYPESLGHEAVIESSTSQSSSRVPGDGICYALSTSSIHEKSKDFYESHKVKHRASRGSHRP